MTKTKVRKASVSKGTQNPNKSAMLLYLQEINKIPLLQADEEKEIAIRAVNGDIAARNRLVNANLRFVVTIAKKYQGSGLPLEDLVSEGNLGLLNAVKNFDVEKGYRFITYAVWWIRQAITKAIQEKGRMIRLPGNKFNDLSKIDKTRQTIQNGHNGKNDHDTREIAAYLEIPEKKAENLMLICQDVLSLDEPTSKDGDSLAIKDFIEDESSKSPVDYVLNSDLKEKLDGMIDNLGDRAASVIRSRYGIGNTGSLTLREIGDQYNLSRERVRQIEKRAMLQLQQSSQKAKLETYIA